MRSVQDLVAPFPRLPKYDCGKLDFDGLCLRCAQLSGATGHLRRMLKKTVSKAAASEEARRTLRYVESLSDVRTKLAGFFSVLPYQIRLRNNTDKGGSVTASEWGSPWEGTALV